MAWTVCFIATVAVLLTATAFSVKQTLFKNKKRTRVLHILMAACFVSAIMLTIPAFYAKYAGESADILKTVVLSLRKAIRLFGADEIYSAVFETVSGAPVYLADAYLVLVLAIQFFAPLLSFGFVLSFFKNTTAYIRYFCAFFRDIYVFAELSDKSFALAKDILKNNEKARVVFTDVSEKENEEISDLVWSARTLGAILFKKDITSINFAVHSKKSAIGFFAMGDDEMNNVGHSLKLISKYNSRDLTRLYIFSTGVESELLLSGREKGLIKVRRIDEVRSLVSNFLYEKGECIFESAHPIAGGQKQISAVIVGLGKRGTEMLKALSWYCQMDGYRIKINVFDRDPLAEERFSSLCPELMSEAYNGVSLAGEAEYSIKIHSGINTDSKAFCDAVSLIKDATYVFVSLGSDEANIKAAVNMRMLFERNGAKPIINAVLGNSDAKEALESAKNSAGQPYNISFIGDIDSFYSERVIIESLAEDDAFARHCSYCGGDKDKEEDFWRYEYCYRSSMASAVHAAARKKCGIAGADKNEAELTPDERAVIESLEHRRWNAYMRAEGYVYSGSPEKSSRNDLAKMHHNLVVYSALSAEDKRKDSRVGAVNGQEE